MPQATTRTRGIWTTDAVTPIPHMCPHWHLTAEPHKFLRSSFHTFGYASFEVITPQSLCSRTHGARSQTANLRANRHHFAPANYFLEYPFILWHWMDARWILGHSRICSIPSDSGRAQWRYWNNASVGPGLAARTCGHRTQGFCTKVIKLHGARSDSKSTIRG